MNLNDAMQQSLNKKYIGLKGEDEAANYYIKTGYEIICRNWRWSNKGEIDIIAYNKTENIIAVCEVKTRKKNSMARPCEAVNISKQKKLKILAQIFLFQNDKYRDAQVRFDVIEAIIADGFYMELNFIKNAF